MLFKDFFARLQAHALAHYGVSLSERQFTNWREKGLIPGPAHPRGRGRGLSPERHWPLAAYRRALRICWYKKRGIDHLPAWWILLWLEGEDVPIDVLRRSLKRELKRSRRRSRYLSDSGYLASTGPTTFGKAPSAAGPNPISLALDQLITSPHLSLSPELYRDVVKLEFNEENPTAIAKVFQDSVTSLMGHDITPGEVGISLIDVWRPGYLGAGGDKYLADCSEADLVLARRILRERARLVRRLLPHAHLLGANRAASILFVISLSLAKRRLGSRQLIDDALRQTFEIVDDRCNGRDPGRRLAFLLESLEAMTDGGEGVTPDEFRAAIDGLRQRSD